MSYPIVYSGTRGVDSLVGPLAPDRIELEIWSGNQYPYRASAYREGLYCGRTGGCKSPHNAERAGFLIWQSSAAWAAAKISELARDPGASQAAEGHA